MLRTLALVFSALILSGCPPKVAEHPKAFDPDSASGADRLRAGAITLPLDEVVTDSLSYKKGDRTDWKVLEAPAARGWVRVALRWDDAASQVQVAAFDEIGVEVSAASATPGQPRVLEWPVSERRRYYLRFMAPTDRDETSYSVQAAWKDDGATRPVEPVVTPDPETEPEEPAANPELNVDEAVQGRIVSSYRDGDALVVYIDKGSAAGVKVGARGVVLEGPSGAVPLVGANFTITKVVDATRSIGRLRFPTIGKNLRVAIETAP